MHTNKLIVISFSVLLIVIILGYQNMPESKIHVLQQPLRIASENNTQYYLLPSGTSLYYDSTLPEGPDRFTVYLNIEGTELKLIDNEPSDLIDPLSAYPIEHEDIIDLIKNYPATKNDIKQVLKTKPIDIEDAQEIITYLQEYIKLNQD